MEEWSKRKRRLLYYAMTRGGGGSTPVAPADFLVTNDAEFATANTTATAGQIIQLQDSGTFTALTLTNATGVTVRGQTSQVPVVRSLTINGAQNATVTGLKIQANSVPASSPKLIDLRGNLTGLVIDNCYIRGGNPWNSYADFDPTVTDTARMGVNPTWGATNPYATDLWYGIGSGGSGATLPSGSITIRNNTLLDLGGGIKWAVGTTASGTLKINGNTIGRCYQDQISLIFGATSAEVTGIEICGNDLYDAFAQPQDNTNPHGDAIQISCVGVYPFPMPNWLIAGNILWFSAGCRGQAQRIFANGFDPTYPLVAPIVVDNVMMSRVTTHGITLVSDDAEGAAWAYVRRNIMLAKPTENALIQNEPFTNTTSGVTASTVTTATIKVGNSTAYGEAPNYIALNTAEAYISYGTDRVSGNITTGLGTTAGAYSTYFDTDTLGEWDAIVDADTALTALTPKSAYSANRPMTAGETAAAFRSRWSVSGNRPWSSMPSWTDWVDLSGVVTSSTQTSEWAYVHAGEPGVTSRAISITGGEYRIADDRAGTNATAWGSTAGTITSGKFLQVRQTASGSGSTSTTLTVTIGSESMDWSVTTASSFARPIVSIEGTTPDLFRISGASTLGADGYTGTLALFGFKMASAPAAQRNIFFASAGTPRVQINVLTSGKIRIGLYNAAGTRFAALDTTANVCDNAAHDILVSWDTNDTSSATGADIYVDGSSSKTATTWPGASTLVSYSSSITSYQFGMPATDTMEIGGVFLHTGSRADLTSSAVRALFILDPAVMGVDGATPLGSQPIHFLVGTAGQSGGWNDAAGINFGSGSKFIKVASASATDVSGSAWA